MGGCAKCASDLTKLKESFLKNENEIQQTLGKALGYPPLFPIVSDVDDGEVCVAPHVAATLAMEAAEKIKELKTALIVTALCIVNDPGIDMCWCSTNHQLRCENQPRCVAARKENPRTGNVLRAIAFSVYETEREYAKVKEDAARKKRAKVRKKAKALKRAMTQKKTARDERAITNKDSS